MTKQDSIIKLRKHLATLFDARYEGTAVVSYARDQGFVDGYMQALTDLATVEDRELLRIIGEERSNAAARADTGPGRLNSTAPVQNFA